MYKNQYESRRNKVSSKQAFLNSQNMLLSIRVNTFLRYQNQQEYDCHNDNYVVSPVGLHEHSHYVKTYSLCFILLFLFSFLSFQCLFSMTSALICYILDDYIFSLIGRWVGNSDFEVKFAAFCLYLQTYNFNLARTVKRFCNPRLLSADHVNNKFFLASNENFSCKFFRRKEDLFEGFWEPESCAYGFPACMKNFWGCFLINFYETDFQFIRELI